jgi:hypothetical protein
MITFNSELEMLKELDNFIYKCKGKNIITSSLRQNLLNHINEFLDENKLNSDLHDFIDLDNF